MNVTERRVEVQPGIALATWEIDGRAATTQSGSDCGADERVRSGHATFLLLHGLASNARLWDMTALELARLGHRVAAADLRGHGESDKPDHGYDFPTLISDITTVSDELALEKPILAGQSFGANLVLEAAWLHPRMTRGIACVDGGAIELSSAFPDWESAEKVLAPPKLVGMHRDEIVAMLREAHPSWPESGIQSTIANFTIREDDTIAPRLSFENHMQILHTLWEHKPSTRFGTLGVPALFVFAGGSGTGPPGKRESARAAEASIPSARVHWFEDSDHDIHAQHPIELARLFDLQVQEGFFAADPAGDAAR